MDAAPSEVGTVHRSSKQDLRVKRLALFKCLIACAALTGAPSLAAQAPTTWDGLVQLKSKRLDLVYLQPGADFRGYTKVMIDPTEVAFEKNWQRDYNRTTRSLSGRISDSDVQRAITDGVTAATDIFSDAWTKAGYSVVTAPGPDVLRVRTGVLNIRLSAPDKMAPGRSMTFAEQAGSATLMVEARDSMTNALLGRAVDGKVVGDTLVRWRTSSSNRADFRGVVPDWAAATVRGMSELKLRSPIQP
jgi:hypothetical protein